MIISPVHLIAPPIRALLYLTLFCIFMPMGAAKETDEALDRIQDLTIDQLEERRKSISEEISQLARYSLRSGVGSIGYRSQSNDSPNIKEFVQIDLGREATIDLIAFAPTIWRDAQSGFQADGFPHAFRIKAGSGKDGSGFTIASFDSTHYSVNRIAPFVIPCDNVVASWIRLEAERLSPRAFEGKFLLQLSEFMVFSGHENLALEAAVSASSTQGSFSQAWKLEYLVDGSLPYLMDAAQGFQSVAFVSSDIESTPAITIDLESTYTLDQINLHTVDQSDTAPQAFAGDYGFPRHLKVEGANEVDFSDARLLLEFRPDSLFEINQIVMKRLLRAPSRYIRLTAVDPYSLESIDASGESRVRSRLGFAEIELYSGGENVAFGKTTVSKLGSDLPARFISALTDGNNSYGKILPLKDWILQLSKRHDLEIELPLVEAELNLRYEKQRANLQLFGWIIVGLVVCTIILFIIDRFLRQRAVFLTKERIAADLHDDLGANLNAIALLGDLAQAAKDSPEKVNEYLERIRSLVNRTSESSKYVINLLHTPGMYEDLVSKLKQSARRITTDLEHDLVIENEELISNIKPRKRIDLFLFYNECLVNTIRHSGATKVVTRLIAGNRDAILVVNDNGIGLPQNGNISGPPSLKRRARLIGGKVSATNRPTGGACITLQFRIK